MSKFKKRVLIVLGAVIFVVVVLVALSKTGNNPVANTINIVFSPIQAVTTKVSEPIENLFLYLSEMKNCKEENDRLKSENETLKRESRNQEEYKKENTRLKKLLQLTDDLANCKNVPAKVISFEPSNWFHSVVINKGSKDGIKISDAVIAESGLVGKVEEVGYNWSRVSTILDSGNAVGIKTTRTGDVGIVEGDAELLKKRRFKLDYISKETSVIEGDVLETSGLGGIYPPGLVVGTVEKIQLDNTGELIKAVVRPAVDFSDIYEVVVVTYWENAVYDREKIMIEYTDEKAKEEKEIAEKAKAEQAEKLQKEAEKTEEKIFKEENQTDNTPKPTNKPTKKPATPAPTKAYEENNNSEVNEDSENMTVRDGESYSVQGEEN